MRMKNNREAPQAGTPATKTHDCISQMIHRITYHGSAIVGDNFAIMISVVLRGLEDEDAAIVAMGLHIHHF